jgi:hypothetical protein
MGLFGVGDTLELTVDPRARHVSTGLSVAPAERYVFTATGMWRDWCKDVGPEGWGSGFWTRFNRVRGAPFFLLCGSIGRDDAHVFPIGTELTDWTVPGQVTALADRQLYLFANDWPGMYWNNRALEEKDGGPLRVRVTRVA